MIGSIRWLTSSFVNYQVNLKHFGSAWARLKSSHRTHVTPSVHDTNLHGSGKQSMVSVSNITSYVSNILEMGPCLTTKRTTGSFGLQIASPASDPWPDILPLQKQPDTSDSPARHDRQPNGDQSTSTHRASDNDNEKNEIDDGRMTPFDYQYTYIAIYIHIPTSTSIPNSRMHAT
jgi:hypothetical protein